MEKRNEKIEHPCIVTLMNILKNDKIKLNALAGFPYLFNK